MRKHKFLLMGPGDSGKTSMKSVVFENYLPRDAQRHKLTFEVATQEVKVLNNLIFNLWDCGGQFDYVNKYLESQREYIFPNVGVMLFVFDIAAMSREGPAAAMQSESASIESSFMGHARAGERDTWTKQQMMQYFRRATQFIKEYSREAKVFCLLNKMDLLVADFREQIYEQRKNEVLAACESGVEVEFFGTSIWDDSLMSAYSSIIRSMLPHVSVLHNEVRHAMKMCNAVDACLFESSAFLCLASATTTDAGRRPTQLSEIVKYFKLTCMGNSTGFQSGVFATGTHTLVVMPFTNCTTLVVACLTKVVRPELTWLVLQTRKKQFALYLESKDAVATALREAL